MSTAKKGVRLAGPSDRTGNGLKSPWYSLHAGTVFQEWHRLNEMRKGCFWAKIYPSGLILEAKKDYEKGCPEVPPRGTIGSFSPAAARRLKKAFLTLHVPGFDLWAFTLTTHQIFTAKEWRTITTRFRMSLKRAGWAGIWRVELQRRKTPHDHVAFWLPPGVSHDDVALMWLNATGEINDPEARANAVHSQHISQDESGWAIYMALHGGKHKESQLGWEGKQWGIWNQSKFLQRKPEVVELTPAMHNRLLRVMRKHETAQRRTYLARLWAKARSGANLANALAAQKAIRLKRRLKVRPLHRGNLLRCTKGESVSAILKAITDGRIST